MLKALKSLLNDAPDDPRGPGEYERRQLQLAVAGILQEMTRVDLNQKPEEIAAAEQALRDLFAVSESEARELMAETGDAARRFTSYFGPVSLIKRWYALPERIRLIEHLWRIAYAEGHLDSHEDHFVRKMAHLLYVPNTDCMLARARARPGL